MKRWRILVADELSAEGMAILAQAGEVTLCVGMDEENLREALPSHHALVVRSATHVTARSLEKASELAVIGRAGIGVDNIDVAAATRRGIVVMNTPQASAVTTGEHAIALLLSLARRIPAADASMRAGLWDKSGLTGTEISGKTLGVIGLGRIGLVVAERGLGLRMQTIAHDPHIDPERAPVGVRLVSLAELLAESDFVSVHVPLCDETRHLLGERCLGAMKPGACLVHAARGGIVDERALLASLESGHLAGAALDVFENEPLPEDDPLRRCEKVILTPHLGANTAEAKRSVSLEMARQIVTCLERGITLNGINVPRIAPGEMAQIAPFLTLAHNLAAFLLQIHAGTLGSLRLSLQGSLPEASLTPLQVAMQVGALKHRAERPVTPVNAGEVASRMAVRVHAERSTLKRDFVNLVRVEALIGNERHFVSGTVLGHRHVRMVELDSFLLDAIPEGPLLVTLHHDRPGVAGRICTILGEHAVNIERLQLGSSQEDGLALAICNLDAPIPEPALLRLRAEESIAQAYRVNL